MSAAVPAIELLGSGLVSPRARRADSSVRTVVIAFAANLLIALAKSAAAAITGSASMLAEAAHSWADAGNEIFLFFAERRSERERDEAHPLGYGREAYVWSMFAAFGLFTAGAVVSISHGISELRNPEPATDFLVAYVVLGIAFVLEGVSLPAGDPAGQEGRPVARPGHARAHLEHVQPDPAGGVRRGLRRADRHGDRRSSASACTSSPARRCRTRSARSWSACCSAVVAVFLIDRNRRFLVGQAVAARSDSRCWWACWTGPRWTG